MELQRLLLRYRSTQLRSKVGSLESGRGRGRVVTLLQRTGPMRQKEMAYLLGSTQHELGETLGWLERGGFITREREGESGPVTVSLTSKGEHTQFDEDSYTEIFGVLSAKEQLQLEEYLDRLCKRAGELLDWKGMPVMNPPTAQITIQQRPFVRSDLPDAPQQGQPHGPAGPTAQERWRDRIQHTTRDDLCRRPPDRPRKPDHKPSDDDSDHD